MSNNETAPIELPQKPGNYQARTSNKWNSIPISSVMGEDSSCLGGFEMKKVGSCMEDEVHKTVSPFEISPGQLYSTASGRMFHAGKMLICLCGLPGRGKTHLSVSLTRYLRWLGVTTQVFHFDDFRRDYLKTNGISPEFFSQKPDDEVIKNMKEEMLGKCMEAIELLLSSDKIQVAIYDAINGLAHNRKELKERFNKINVNVVFIESLIEGDSKLLKSSLRDATKSPDYEGWESELARSDFERRIKEASGSYETIDEQGDELEVLSYIKFINFGERLISNRLAYGYLINRITFFLLNSRIKKGSIFFARCGDNQNKLSYKEDPPLSDAGKLHSAKLESSLTKYLTEDKGIPLDKIKNNLLLWTSTRRRTVETGSFFAEKHNVSISQRSELTQLIPGNVEGITSNEEISKKFPLEYKKFINDPYHARFPRGESYHDLAVRLEPLILEMERSTKSVLIIGHESVLRVLYGYLLNTGINDIPFLKFPSNEIVEVRYNSYSNSAKRIPIL